MIEIILDTREKKLQDCLPQCKIEQLSCGDIIFKRNDEIVGIVERKTLSDLQSSIIDGRYREQKARLLSNYIQVWYIFEGINHKNMNTLHSAMLNCIVRDKINVYRTKDETETSNIIELLAKKLEKQTYAITNKYTPISSIKKENITPEEVYISQLCCIPGISRKTALLIQKHFSNMKTLLNNVDEITSIPNIGKRIQESINKNLLH